MTKLYEKLIQSNGLYLRIQRVKYRKLRVNIHANICGFIVAMWTRGRAIYCKRKS
jgi:hypothetical protein